MIANLCRESAPAAMTRNAGEKPMIDFHSHILPNVDDGPDNLDDSLAMRRGALLGALTLYLDFINMFLALLRLFGRRK